MLLEAWSSNENTNATKFIKAFCDKFNCSRSAAWERLNVIKRAGIVDCGSIKDKGRCLKVTKFGEVILEVLYAE